MRRLQTIKFFLGGAVAFATCLALLPGRPTAAQSPSFIYGGIVRDETGSPVPGAEVRIRCGQSELGQTTDGSGGFEFRSIYCASVKLTVHAAGFGEFGQKWDANNSKQIEIVLKPERIQERISVTATLTQEKGSESSADTTVLTRSDLSTTAALPLDGVLKQVPGFVLFRRTPSTVSNPTAQGVSLRAIGASGASRGLVLYDGIPVNDPFGGWIYWDRIPGAAVETVEVARGGFSSLYGDDAMGGVINVIPRRPKESSLRLDSSAGSEGTLDLSSLASVRLGRWIVTADGGAFRTGGYVLVDKSERGIVDTAANSNHSSGSVELTRVISDRSRAFARAEVFRESRHNGTPLQRNQTHFRQVAAGADLASENGTLLVARAFLGTEIFDQTFSAVASDRNSEALTNIQRVPSQQWGISAHALKPLGAHQTIVVGFEGDSTRGASDEVIYRNGLINSGVDAGGRQRVLGFFAEDILRFGSKGIVTVGAREDDWRNARGYSTRRPISIPGPETVLQFQDRTERSFSPRLGFVYGVNAKLTVRASGYRAFRAPTLNELYRSFRVGNVVTQANAALLAERMTGAETGATYRLLGDRATVRATYFWSELSRPIANVTLSVTPSLITRQRQNLGRTRAQGVELEWESRVGAHWSLDAGYQFADSRVTSFSANPALVGLLLPHVPRNEVTGRAVYRRALFTAAIQARGVGNEFDDDQNRLILGRYFSLDAFLSRSLGHGLEGFVAGENLLNDRYDVARTPVRTIGPPASLRAGIRIAVR